MISCVPAQPLFFHLARNSFKHPLIVIIVVQDILQKIKSFRATASCCALSREYLRPTFKKESLPWSVLRARYQAQVIKCFVVYQVRFLVIPSVPP